MEQNQASSKPDATGQSWFLRGSVFSGLMAFIGASCCVLPILLVNLGVSSMLVGHLVIFAKYKDGLLALSLFSVALALWFSFRRGRKPDRTLITWLGITMLLILAAYILPHYEGMITQWVFRR